MNTTQNKMETKHDNISTFLDTHGIYSGSNALNNHNAREEVSESYWTTCPFRPTQTDRPRYVINKETTTFAEFTGITGRFRKSEIRVGGTASTYERLSIAYKDTKLNKGRFDRPSIDDRPSWVDVRNYADVMVMWKERTYTLSATASEMWFLPAKVMYVGVETKEEFHNFNLSIRTTYLMSPVPNPRTPHCVPVRKTMVFRNYHDQEPAELEHDDYYSHRMSLREGKILMTDGTTIDYRPSYENRPLRETFLEECEERLLPHRFSVSTTYVPIKMGTSKLSVKYHREAECVSVVPFSAVRKTISTPAFADDRMDTLVSKKDALKEELMASVYHPDRLERLYGDKMVDMMEHL
jgi:hypothetical protein